MIAHAPGADPGAVVYDALDAAVARGADLVIADTAGRLHTKSNLMDELTKIRRIIDKRLPGAEPETLFVLDATTGQNGLAQAKAFHEAVGLTGIVLTKLDSTAKGGIVFAIEDALKVPVRFVGVGEAVGDLIVVRPRRLRRRRCSPEPVSAIRQARRLLPLGLDRDRDRIDRRIRTGGRRQREQVPHRARTRGSRPRRLPRAAPSQASPAARSPRRGPRRRASPRAGRCRPRRGTSTTPVPGPGRRTEVWRTDTSVTS